MNSTSFCRNIISLIVFSMISFGLGCDAGAPRKTSEEYEKERSGRVAEESRAQNQKGKETVTPVHEAFSKLLGETKPNTQAMGAIFNGVDPADQENLNKSQDFLNRIDSIDVSQCPKNYQDIFRELSNHWKQFHQRVVANNGKVLDRSKTAVRPGFQNETYAGITQRHEGIRTNDPTLEGILNSIKTSSTRYDNVCKGLRLPGLW